VRVSCSEEICPFRSQAAASTMVLGRVVVWLTPERVRRRYVRS
jgi:hypothetical protein